MIFVAATLYCPLSGAPDAARHEAKPAVHLIEYIAPRSSLYSRRVSSLPHPGAQEILIGRWLPKPNMDPKFPFPEVAQVILRYSVSNSLMIRAAAF